MPLHDAWPTHPGLDPPDSIKLEPELRQPYADWHARPHPAHADALLKALRPTIDTGVKAFGGPHPSPMTRSRAKRFALDAARTYEPQKGPLRPHLLNHLRALQGYSAASTRLVSVPERVALDRRTLHAAEAELEDRLGRPPSSLEVQDHSGLSAKRQAYVRQYVPGLAEGQSRSKIPGGDDDGGGDPAVERAAPIEQRLEFLLPDLDPVSQALVEHGFGLHGREKLTVGAIARKFGMSPAAISQRAAKIQGMLDELDDSGVLQ